MEVLAKRFSISCCAIYLLQSVAATSPRSHKSVTMGVRSNRFSLSKEGNMPNYEFQCEKCKKTFTETLTFKEYDQHKVKCPKCGGTDVQQVISSTFAKTSKKS